MAFAAGAGGDEPVAVAGEGEFADGRAAGGFQAGEDPAVGQSDQSNAGISLDEGGEGRRPVSGGIGEGASAVGIGVSLQDRERQGLPSGGVPDRVRGAAAGCEVPALPG